MTASSGIQDDGRFLPAFPGQREPFTTGNKVAVKHGAYSALRLEERAGELVDELREIVPAFSVADGPTVQVLAFVLARLEAASQALAGAEGEELRRLREDARGWANTARRYFNDLGLTPTSRARLRLGVVLGDEAYARLDRHLSETYGKDGERT